MLTWKKAKKRASIVARFIRRESKGEDEVSLLRTASIRSNHSHMEHIERLMYRDVLKEHEESKKVADIEQTTFEDSFTPKETSFHIVSSFDDSFISKENKGLSPIRLKISYT